MAMQTSSPHEARIARRLLAEEGIDVDAPTAPAANSRFMTRDQILSTPNLRTSEDLDYELDIDEALGRARMYFGRPGPRMAARG